MIIIPQMNLRLLHLLAVVFVIILPLSLLTGCGNSPLSRSMLPWTNRWQIVQRAVTQIDADAVPIQVVASPTSRSTIDDRSSLHIDFRFIRPSGLTIHGSFEDRQITDTLTIDMSIADKPVDALLPEESERLRQAVATVRVSPMEALQKTLLEGRTFSQQNEMQVDPLIGLHMEKEIEEGFGVPAVWLVSYLGPPKELRIWINAQTGVILKREIK